MREAAGRRKSRRRTPYVTYTAQKLSGDDIQNCFRVDIVPGASLDLKMAVMDGITATKLIRSSDHPDHNIPIFAMTANTFATDRKRCEDAGMNGLLQNRSISMRSPLP